MEGIDRLLAIAHHKDRPGHRAGRFAAGEFVGQPLDHTPLPGAGILRLIHKDVVDSAIEPEQHPLRHRRRRQKVARALDQVIEIEQAAQPLALRIKIKERPRETMKRQVAFDSGQAQPQGACLGDALHQIVEIIERSGGQQFLRRFCRNRPYLGRKWPCFRWARPSQQPPFKHRQRLNRRLVDRGENVRVRHVSHAALAHEWHKALQHLDVLIGQHIIEKDLGRQARRQIKGRHKVFAGQIGRKARAIPNDILQQPAQIFTREMAQQVIQEPRLRPRGDLFQEILGQEIRRALIHLGKAMRDTRLKRKTPQQRRTERVNRLDLEATRRLDRLGKKAPRLGQIRL